VDEYGFSTSIQRRTSYSYLSGTYVDNNLLQLVNHVIIYNGSNLSTPVAKTDLTYDDYLSTGGMVSPTPLPPNHDPSFNSTWTIRGNVTAVTTWVNPISGPSITRYSKYDMFGDVVRADVSCCNSKSFSFSDATTHYSQPDSVTDGTPNVVPFLTTSFAYDLNTGLALNATDPQNRTTSFHYDSAWHLDTVTPPQSAFSTTTQFDKDINGNDLLAYAQRVSYTDVDGISKTTTSKSWFDGAGRVIRAGTGQGPTPASFDAVKSLYDPVGRVLKQSNPYPGDASGNGSPAHWTVNTYDPLSRVKTVTLPDLQTIQTTYNSAIVTVTDQVGRKRQSQVDGLGRLISVSEQDPATAALSLVTTYNYDTLDNLKGVNQGGQTRSFVYDALSRMTSQNTPEGGPVGFTYTDFGAVATRTDPRGVVTTYGYDPLNRLASVGYNMTNAPGVTATTGVTISYKTSSVGNGEVESVTDGAGTQSYVYDSLGRTASKTRTIDGNSYQTQYQYNSINQLSVITYPSNKQVRRNHDMRGRLNGIDKLSGGLFVSSYVSGVVYNTAGQETGLTDGSGVAESYTYSNDRLQLTRQTAVKGATTLMDLNYSYASTTGASGVGATAGDSGQLMAIINNPNAQPSTINGQNRNQAFTYDDVGRLVTATGTGATLAAWQRRFAYDRWGNRTGIWDATVGGNQIQSVVVQQQQGAPAGVPSNRLTSVTNNGVTSSYLYDAAGNLTSDGAHTYQYDGEGRITTVDNGSAASYFYDSANRRVKKVVGSTTTYYIWQGAQVIAEYSNAPAATGGTSYYLADRLSTRMTTDTTGAFKATQDHLPFGDDGGTTGTSEKHRFTSYERDGESNTDYAMNRQYGMNNGRFMQPDPIEGSVANPQSLNRYSYAIGDPVNLTDRTGLDWFDDWISAAHQNNFANGASFGAWINDQQDRAFFGDRYYDLPGNNNEMERAMLGYERRLANTYDAIRANAAFQSGDTNTAYALMAGNHSLYFSDDPYTDDDGQAGRVFKGYSPNTGPEAKDYGDAMAFIADLMDWLSAMAQEKQIQAGNKKGMIMNLDGTVHFHTVDGKSPTLFNRNEHLGHFYYPPNQSDYCPPGQACMGARRPCNTWPNGCWYPDFERDEYGGSIVRAPKSPAPFYYFNFK
jgi:RHS repeat-associated protein